ncbi:MAG TPA: T9SS type A sorting domain-containing protein [Chitinophagales bacterium]|nr:T9SS type A sorting domain-containing protein [Chitinophagales bacterium]
MKRILQLVLAILVLFTPYAQGQTIFSEDFDGVGGPTAGGAGTYSFPAGWLLRNVDNGTPATSVAYVNEAWERREDFSFNVADSTAFSTSWTVPATTSNDWMWTPLIGPLPAGAVLKWNAVTYDASYRDGYEVRIMTAPNTPTGGTGVIGNQITNSTVLFSTGAENTTWTPRQVSLNAYAGQSVYIAFRNNSFDKFLLLIDDVSVEVVITDDVQIVSSLQSEYTLTPVSQVPAGGIALGSTVRNNGTNAASNVVLTANVYNSASTLVHTASSAATPLAAGATVNLTLTGFVPTVADIYTVAYDVTMAATDQVPANSVDTTFVNITDAIYARDNGTVVQALGIGSGNGGYLGQDFMIENTATVGSIQIYYTQGFTGERLGAVIWDMSGGVPNAIVATTDTLTYIDNAAGLYTLPINGGNVTLAPGRYAFTAIEFDSTVSIGLTTDIYTPNRTWVDWPTNPLTGWANNEDFGASFERAYVIRPVICPTIAPNLTTAPATCLAADGTAAVAPTGGEAPYTYEWTTGSTDSTVTGAAGAYTVTITDNLGCEATVTATIATNTVALTSTTSATQSTCTAVDGSVSVTATNGNSPYSYLWSNGATTSTVSNLADGTYTVTLEDANGCSGTNTATVTVNTVTLTSTTTSTDATCLAADGSASVTVTNGTSPYDYLWSNGEITATIANEIAGTYTVTVTDDNGCSGTNSATVNSNVVALTSTVSSTNATCTAADGSATVTVTNGTSPFDYDWSNGASTSTNAGLTAGTYNVTLSDDNGCTGTTSVTVNSNAVALTSTVSSTNASCSAADGTASVTVTNGTTPYDYDWSNGGSTATITSLAAGTYTVTLTDDNGCTGTNSVTVSTNGIVLTSTTSSTDATCTAADGSATVTVTNGASPYEYDWSNGATTATNANLAAGTYTVTLTDDNGCTGTTSVTVSSNAVALTSTTSSTNAICTAANGSATVTITNGTSPYDYDWSNGASTATASNLAANTYNVTLTDDNGCTGTASVTVVADVVTLSGNASATPATCSATDGTATAAGASGTAPYSYEWSNNETTATITGLAPGTYNVTITDDNGCTGTDAAVVTTNQVALTLATSSTETACSANTGSATVDNVTNGTSPYEYDWSNSETTASVTGLAAGSYQVTVTDDNGCSATADFTIGTVAGPTGTATATNAACNGGTDGDVDLTVSGGTSPFTYSWDNSATSQNLTDVAVGTYNVTITDDNGCTATATATVTEPTALALSAVTTDPTSGSNGSINLTVAGGTSPYTFDWSNSATTEDLSGVAAGTYTVTVTDDNGCSTTAAYTLLPVGIATVGQVNMFNVFPNPATNSVQIQISLNKAEELKMELVNIAGQVVMTRNTGNFKDNTFVLNLSEYAAGVYFIRLSGPQVNSVERLVIER